MRIATFLLCLIVIDSAFASDSGADGIAWQDWDDELFKTAQAENRPVLLNLEAVWCHWCHVMDANTYSDPAVMSFLSEHFIAVKADHDARPDLAGRYRDYGWPATIIFAPDGTELAKRTGYIPPKRMMQLLSKVVSDPASLMADDAQKPPVFAHSPLLDEAVRVELLQRHRLRYDTVNGGLDISKKFIDEETVEYAMLLAANGDSVELQRAQQTLDGALALIDPQFGGAYQYSTHGDWQHPHFEKIMSTQAGYTRIYTLAYLQFGQLRYLRAAESIANYMLEFLRAADGAFYTSQDADLVQGEHAEEYFALDAAARRAVGIPRIDKHNYAGENGLAIEALALLSQVSADSRYLAAAIAAADWVIANRSLPGGGFRHDLTDIGGPFLNDSLRMGSGAIELYRATGDRRYLLLAQSAANFIDQSFRQTGAGYLAAVPVAGPVGPVPDIMENIHYVRFANLISHLTGNKSQRESAEHAMRYLATRSIALARINESGILLAEHELANDPDHYTIVGSKTDPLAATLYSVALAQPGWYRRVEWWDRSEGPMPNPDVGYPPLDRSAAYVCTQSRCSLPAFDETAFKALILKLLDKENP